MMKYAQWSAAAPLPGGSPPPGVPANRGGHGVRAETVIDELTGAGFSHVRTIRDWSANMYLVLSRKPGS